MTFYNRVLRVATAVAAGVSVPTLKASRLGIARIKQARIQKGWGWSTASDDTCLVEASQVLEPDRDWGYGGPYAADVSEGTWKRFLAGLKPISANGFKAYCKILDLNWEEIVDRPSRLANPCQDGGDAVDPNFYGRTAELAQMEQWIVRDRCRIVALLGMGGIGKTALSVKLAEQIQHQFEYSFRRSLRHAPPLPELLAEIFEFLADGQATGSPTIDGQISQLIEYLNTHRCLLLLDDVEVVLRSEELAGQYRDGYQGYGELIRRVGEERHQSCLVLISREQPREIASLAGATLPVRVLKLRGLPPEDAKSILEAKGLSSLKGGWEELIQLYMGNPFALKIITNTVQEIFDGNISQFLSQSTLILGDVILNLLNEQFERFSTLEKEVIYWLALENQFVSLSELRVNMRVSGASLSELLAALESLKRRSMLEKEIVEAGQPLVQPVNEAIFILQPVVRKYAIAQFIEQFCRDTFTVVQTQSLRKLGLLRSHALVKEEEQDEVKEIQIRLVLARIMDKLYLTASSANSVEEQLNQVRSLLQGKSPQVVGYAETNILNLLSITEGR